MKQFKVKAWYSCFVLDLRMPSENCLTFNWNSSKAAPGISFLKTPTNDDKYSTKRRNNIVLVITRHRVMKTIQQNKFKKWYAVSRLFLLNCIFHYISNWSNKLELDLSSVFNMRSWSAKFWRFLGDFSIDFEALFVHRAINNYYMTLLMALHHTHDGLLYFFRCCRSIISGTLPTLNLSIKIHPSLGSCIFSDVILVSNYHSDKGETIKLLPCHSFYGGHIPIRKAPGSPFNSIALKNVKDHLPWTFKHSSLT